MKNIAASGLFDIGQTDDGLPQYSRLLCDGRRLGRAVDESLIIKRDCTQLKAGEIKERVGEIRFFGIDGEHMLPHVVADSRLAMDSLAEHRVIALDDPFNPGWPEGTVGFADFLRGRGRDFS